jgi:ankyrin repeat protein
MRAAAEDNGVLEVLLERGASVNAATNAGFTALMIAAASGRTKNTGLLLSKGADPRLKNKDGDDASALAMKAEKKRQLTR